jgi:hypothetical protein
MWKEAIVVQFEILSRHFSGLNEKNMKIFSKSVGFPN